MKYYQKKPQIIFFLSLLVFSLILVSACSRPAPVPAPSPTPAPPSPPSGTLNESSETLSLYLPLQVGNSWTYEGIGNEFASYSQKVTHQIDNKAQVILSSGTVTANRYEFTEDSILHTFQEHEFYEDKSILDRPANLNAVLLKLPLEVGTSWTSESNSYKIIETNGTVETPAGIFKNCLAVKTVYKDSGNHSINYYAKGIGMVKSEYIMPEDQKVISQLSSYSIVND